MSNSTPLLLAYYGDDFTGSTDALEFLSRAGIRSALFIAPPTPAQLARHPNLQALGIAGMTRSMTPIAMENELRPAFTALKNLNTPHVHYKVCSTFDSSPTIGSIGRAIDVGAEIFHNAFIPLLVAAPALGRHCIFGNLFARMGTGGGIGSTGDIFRLDRHPSMSRHPVTPADESDLRKHLARQTPKTTALFDILQLALSEADARASLEKIIATHPDIVLFDALYPEQLQKIGALLDPYASPTNPLFSVGSSGIEMALGAHWSARQNLTPKISWPNPGPAAPLLVISGSCSPITEKQISTALQNNFAEVPLDVASLVDAADPLPLLTAAAAIALAHINAGTSVILHTSRGNTDPRLPATAAAFARKNILPDQIKTLTADLFGTALGAIARTLFEKTKSNPKQNLRRLLIAGGDTSSYAARALGVEAVEMIAPLAPGAPLCRAYAPNSPADGIELNFKGGQVGAENYFLQVQKGAL